MYCVCVYSIIIINAILVIVVVMWPTVDPLHISLYCKYTLIRIRRTFCIYCVYLLIQTNLLGSLKGIPNLYFLSELLTISSGVYSIHKLGTERYVLTSLQVNVHAYKRAVIL